MDFLKAIRNNDLSKVQRKLNKGVDPNKPIPEYNQYKEIVATIPLCLAATHGFRDLTELLVIHGANIHACNLDWSSPLHMATYHDHINVIRYFLKRGVNLNNSDQHGNTVLHLAATRNNFEATVLFLEHKIDISIRNSLGQTAMDLAKIYKHHHIIGLINDEILAQSERLKRSRRTSKVTVEILNKPLDLNAGQITEVLNVKEQALQDLTTEVSELSKDSDTLNTEMNTLDTRLREVKLEKTNKDNEKNFLEQEIERLRAEITQLKNESPRSPDAKYECPICFELPLPPRKVFQCKNGHVYCSECKEKPGMNTCPQCRVPLNQKTAIRNIVFEQMVEKKSKRMR